MMPERRMDLEHLKQEKPRKANLGPWGPLESPQGGRWRGLPWHWRGEEKTDSCPAVMMERHGVTRLRQGSERLRKGESYPFGRVLRSRGFDVLLGLRACLGRPLAWLEPGKDLVGWEKLWMRWQVEELGSMGGFAHQLCCFHFDAEPRWMG